MISVFSLAMQQDVVLLENDWLVWRCFVELKYYVASLSLNAF